jgi:hypothetical protein
MQSIFLRLFFAAAVSIIISCGGKNQKNQPGSLNNADSVANVQTVNNQPAGRAADSTLVLVQQFFEKELTIWAQSFKGFHIDSFRMTQSSGFEQTDYNETHELKSFYELYKPSLSFSPDSSWFIDLYSAGVMLEKKGKKIIASADVDQAVTLCNLKTKEWKRIVSFGPSAGIEEAIWISPSAFMLAGTMQNDNGEEQPIVVLGDVNSKTFRWFEANAKRPESSNYKASGLGKLKIDEWE